ncbi:MAG TPA: phage/plasmid primase, P4 family [Micromonosporaceae bacterium]|nr:phage/plasmid primase, P4 family [Micromonosporaceae bacterium]
MTFLLEHHRQELVAQSAIDPAVLEERGYRTVGRPTPNDDRPRQDMKRLGIPSWALNEDRYFPGLLIPMYRATGERISWQWKPRVPVPDRDGKPRRYASVKGHANRLDVHPRNRDRIVDPTVPLWITEGVKKADSLTSRGCCVVALTGVFNWRGQLATLGDWEDVPLRGRQVIVCFDADARTKKNVLRAMQRLGRWLRSKGANPLYLIVPDEVNGTDVKGADDFFAAGGTLVELVSAATTTPPKTDAPAGAALTDAVLAETITDAVLDGQYVWCKGLGWLNWDGRRWAECSDEAVGEPVRLWAVDKFAEIAKTGERDLIDAWRCILSLGKQRAALNLARGIVERRADEFDAHPDLLNTPSGVVDMRTGDALSHSADLLLTKMTSGSYRPGYTHPDWQQALTALPDTDTADWFQARIGQGATGHRAPDGVNVVMQGGGENGKGALGSDGIVPALGDYATIASHKLIADSNEHSEEQATLRGKRLIVAEELTENRALNVTAIKRISDVASITARHVHQRNMTFRATHTLFATTNYIPVVNEVDHGTWRRLALLPFPYTYRKPWEPLLRPTDRAGDPQLKSRIENNTDEQHDAIVTWVVDGAIRWYKDGAEALRPPRSVVAATDAWRATADRILGFWRERLIEDRDSCVLATEMLDAFNDWLKENGHNRWSRELFAPRFGPHMETTRHGVELRRERNLSGVSRWSGSDWGVLGALPSRAWVWRGVRFQTASDQEKDETRPEWPESEANSSTRGRSEKVAGDSGHSGQDESSNGPVADDSQSKPSTNTCARWLGDERRFCGRTNNLRQYLAGPLCPEHQPKSA